MSNTDKCILRVNQTKRLKLYRFNIDQTVKQQTEIYEYCWQLRHVPAECDFTYADEFFQDKKHRKTNIVFEWLWN